MASEVWSAGGAYEAYVGRWSSEVAVTFLRWLDVPAGRRWLDVGCGTGALTDAVLTHADPASVVGVDPSEGFLAHARGRLADARVALRVGDARSLPVPDGGFDAVVSGLALNFVPDPDRAVAEFARAVAPGGVAAAYVWDYAEGMAMMRHFWDAAAVLDPDGAALDEGSRFPLCRPDNLRVLWAGGGFDDVAVRAIEIPTHFGSFDDYWRPFLGGQGAAPGYLATLPEPRRQALAELLRERLPAAPDGSLPLTARAWAVRGTARRPRPAR
ncbi:MAG TPA: class I SAM-dependent methyltransferase [Pilimelia sp.]|nr:class I SAM-dependent methyltransferase [Pilimelia sp.]